MTKLLSVAKLLNINERVMLPKNFKKEKPNAKIADYPAFTGYTALHFGNYTICIFLFLICFLILLI
jgi:hypothetical protein